MLITLTTDFGVSSPYVGAMKGVVLSVNPRAALVDLSHSIPPQDILAAAQVLRDVTLLFPPGTLHVAVVDPGVGTARRIVYVELAGQRYLVPDNGILGRLAEVACPTKIVEVTRTELFRQPVSATFHGRDVFAPVAAHLSLDFDPETLGPPLDTLEPLDWPGVKKMPHRIAGEVVAVDSFGNLVTNITRQMLAGVPTDESVAVRCDEHETRCIFNTYADQPEMTLIALVGSNDQLELAIVNDSAAMMLGVRVGTPVEVLW